ncbi:HIT domain-containing protein [Euzebya sp.]|uniref:HIT family protein n=1 Tax=Euzebya sp. TaxID=1971409 RepID=UPI0035176EDB
MEEHLPAGADHPDADPLDERTDHYGRLYTPWRMEYIRDPGRSEEGCPFCVDADSFDDSRVLHRGQTAFVILNAYPYNPGHVMVIPYTHTDDYTTLSAAETQEIADLTQRVIRAMAATVSPHGVNVGMNLGTVAGAGIADHLHQHVVPRWGGDTNFMPVIGQTRVLPQLMRDTYDLLKPALEAQMP